MILPCRIHRARNRVDSLPLALLVSALLALQSGHIYGQDAVGSPFEASGIGWLPAVPIQITAGVDAGYDDNVTTSASGQGSVFARENVVLTYDRPGRTEFYLLGIGRFSQFFDVTGQDETAGNVTMSLTHNFSTRLSFYASIYGAYQTEPNFQSDVGPENVRAAFFYTSDIFSVTYHWLPRLTTVTSYTFARIKYDESSIGSFQDRVQGTFSEQLQFSLTSRTNLSGQYRFETINYDTATTDSTAHYLLAGFDHHLTEHLIFHILGGGSFRSFENDGNTANPYFESSLGYRGSNHTVNWTTSYDFEPANQEGVSIRKTLRTGLNMTYGLTSRISSTAGVYFHHDDNEGVGSQDSLDLNLSLRYTITKRLTAHVDYAYTSISSLASTPGYSRNRYFAGLNYTY
jgi:Uncharacterized protein conserved in bacteria (DUF2320).